MCIRDRRNHTDKTEVIVAQLAGRKEWLYCREKPTSAAATRFPLQPALDASKLDKCKTYDAAEMDSGALACERATTAPGDALFLPRRACSCSARGTSGSASARIQRSSTAAVPAVTVPDRASEPAASSSPAVAAGAHALWKLPPRALWDDLSLRLRETARVAAEEKIKADEAAAAITERGCDVNAKGNFGYTALHCAGAYNRRETARVLLERGADRTIKNKYGNLSLIHI